MRNLTPVSGILAAPGTPAGVRQTATRVAAGFASHAGCRVGLFLGSPENFAGALLGLLHAGCEPVILPHDAPDMLVSAAEVSDILLLDSPAETTGSRVIGLENLPADEMAPPAMPEDRYVSLFTSGSSGKPTLIHKPLSCLEAEIAVQETVFGADADDRLIMATVAHQHIYGLLFSILWPLMSGRKAAWSLVEWPEQIELVRDQKVLLVSSPAFLSRVHDRANWGVGGLGNIMILSSGGPLSASVASSLNNAGGNSCTEIFGSTETGGVALRQVVQQDVPVPWNPLPGVQVGLGEAGALHVRSPFIADTSGFTMGDGVELLDDGCFRLGPRLDRIVKVAEKRISLTDAENHLCRADLVTECRMVPLEENRRTSIGVAVILSGAGLDVLEQKGRNTLSRMLRSHMLDHLEPVTVPRKWRYLTALPWNSQGKVTRDRLLALFQPVAHYLSGLSDGDLEDGRIVRSIRIDHDLACLEGHFPGQPIVPGVVQLNWAIQLACEAFDLTPEIERVDALKFQSVLEPGTLARITLEPDLVPGRVSFSIQSDRPHSKGRLQFRMAAQ